LRKRGDHAGPLAEVFSISGSNTPSNQLNIRLDDRQEVMVFVPNSQVHVSDRFDRLATLEPGPGTRIHL